MYFKKIDLLNINIKYDKKNDILYTNNIKLKEIKTLDEYSRQKSKKSNKPPNHGGFYIIKNKYKNIKSEKNIFNNVLLVPISSIGGSGPWHMMHHLFLFYSNIIENNINDIDNIIFYLFTCPHDVKREKKIIQHKQPSYLKLFFDILNIKKDWKIFKKEHEDLHNLFYNSDIISIKNLKFIFCELENFNNEKFLKPYMLKFKEEMIKIYNLKKKEENITIICRRENRKFVNQEELKNFFDLYSKEKKINCNIVYLEDYNFKKQIEIFLNSKIIIGVHGAGLTWHIFMEKNSNIIEIFPKNGGKEQYNDYFWFSKLSDINYIRTENNYIGNISNFRKCNIILEKNNINDILNKIV